MRSTIYKAHQKLSDIIGTENIEPVEAALEVERLRQEWRPHTVRTVLLAESHVWTSEPELRRRVRVPGWAESSYVRFVYCLGYGESSLVIPREKLTNSGTWQYWRLFQDCVYGPEKSADVLKRVTRDDDRRIQAKLRLLVDMQDAGIWLVDASVTGLVGPGKKVAPGNKYRDVLSASWDLHVGDVLGDSEPSKVLIVGRGVAGVLQERIQETLPRAKISTIPQPNARLSATEINEVRQHCWDFCR